LVRAAGKVVLKVWAEGGDVSSGVADRDVAVALLVSVGLHVAGSSLDKRSGDRVVRSGEDFVANEETCSVVKLLELIHDGCKVVVLCLVPGWVALHLVSRGLFVVKTFCISYWVDLGGESVEIDEEVDTGVGKGAHTALVVSLWVDMVYTNGIRSKLLHELSIETALVVVDERIGRSQLVGNAWKTSVLRREWYTMCDATHL